MTDPTGAPGPGLTGKLAVAWLIVGVPLVWGVWQVVHKSLALFR